MVSIPTTHEGLIPDATNKLLDVRNLACSVGNRNLWQDLSFTLQPGERLAVAGSSGSGKTLLLRILAGLRDASAGDIHFEGKSISDWHMPAYRARVTWVPQRPTLAESRVRDILSAPFALRSHQNRAYPSDTVRSYLDQLKLPESFLDQRSDDLSGGEAQLVAAMRAILIEPTLLLLDEPTASLDGTRACAMEALFDHWLRQKPDRAYLWSSHDADQLSRVADRTLNLEHP